MIRTLKSNRSWPPFKETGARLSGCRDDRARGYLSQASGQRPELYQQYQTVAGNSPAIGNGVHSVDLVRSSTLHPANGRTVPLTKPVLVYDTIRLDNRDVLQGHIVWPQSYEQATQNLRNNHGGLFAERALPIKR
jgi:hypothetical protein